MYNCTCSMVYTFFVSLTDENVCNNGESLLVYLGMAILLKLNHCNNSFDTKANS
jgi:hypothetical protein